MKRFRFPLAIASAITLALGLSSRATARPRVAAPRRFDGSGSAELLNTAPNSSTWTLNGMVTVTGLGRCNYHQSGEFTSFEQWRATQTITSPNGDTVRSSSVGGVIANGSDAGKIQTTDTITGGTGRYSGARGRAATIGETVVNPAGIQVFTFHFSGSITRSS